MKLSPIAQQLREQCPSLRGVAVLPVSARQAVLPFAGVYLLSERAKPNPLLGGHAQEVELVFGVEVAFRHAAQTANSGTDSPLLDVLEQLREEILPALVGWTPATGYAPCNFVGGRLTAYKDGVMFWMDQFVTTFYRQGQS